MRSAAAPLPRAPFVDWQIGVFLVSAILVGAAATFISVRVLLFMSIALVLSGPLVHRAARRQFDLLEPLFIGNIALGVMFLARPIATVAYDEMAYEGRFDIEPTFDRVLVIALVGIVTYTVGYSLGVGPTVSRRLPAPPQQLHRDTASLAALFLVGLAAVGYAIYALRAGFSPLSVFSGGGLVTGGDTSTAYFYMTPFLVLPAALLLMTAGFSGRRRAPTILVLVFAVLVFSSVASAGQRLIVLLLLGSLVAYPMLRNNWRPGPLLILALLPTLLVGTVAMRDLQLGGGPGALADALLATARDPLASVRRLLTENDTEMFSAFAVELQVVPAELPYQPGSAVTTLLAHPLPRILWPAKPRASDDVMNVYIDESRRFGDRGRAFSLLGGFYYDSGVFGVAAGMFIIGIGLRTFYEYFRVHADSDVARMLFAAGLPLLTVVLLRGNLTHTFSFVPFTMLPLVAVAWVAARRTAREPAGREFSR